MQTTVEQLPESKVRLDVEVPEHAVHHAFEHAAGDLAREMRIPGFRRGKAPLPVVTSRVGRQAVAAEAVKGHIESWFWEAVADARIRPVADPEIHWESLPSPGGTFTFSATVPVAPKPELVDLEALEVPAPEAAVPAELVDAELERLRVGVAELVPVKDRPVREGDTVVLDLEGEETSGDYVIEVGAGRLREVLEDALVGLSEGETRVVELELENGKKRTSSVEMKLKEIKERSLPPLDDSLAKTASEFETLDELRADIEAKLLEQLTGELELGFREAALDALVEASTIDSIEPIVQVRLGRLWSGLVGSLEKRGISLETYLAAIGQTQDQIIERLRGEADRSVRRELVLEAVADERAIQVSDDEVEELIRSQAGELADDPDAAIGKLREGRGFEKLREDLRLKKALDDIVASVRRIPVELARAREKLWTPEKEKGGPGMKIWTPGSEEQT